MLNAVSWKLNDDTDRITIKQPKKNIPLSSHYPRPRYGCICVLVVVLCHILFYCTVVVVVVVVCHTLGSNWSDRCLPLPL